MNKIYKFKTDDNVYGIIVDLIDSDHYEKIEIDISVDNIDTSLDIPFFYEINKYTGEHVSVFKTLFKPFKTDNFINICFKKAYVSKNTNIIIKLLTKELKS
jgi:hypothetical protein